MVYLLPSWAFDVFTPFDSDWGLSDFIFVFTEKWGCRHLQGSVGEINSLAWPLLPASFKTCPAAALFCLLFVIFMVHFTLIAHSNLGFSISHKSLHI